MRSYAGYAGLLALAIAPLGATPASARHVTVQMPHDATPRAVVDADSPLVAVGSYVRIEYTRWFVRRSEIVDSADALRATRSRRFEARGTVEQLTPTQVVLRQHDRTRSIRRWQIDRAWVHIPSRDSRQPGEGFAEWGIGGFVVAGALAGLVLVGCEDSDEYCGLGTIVLMGGAVAAGIVTGLLASAGDDDAGFVEVRL